MVSLRTPEGKKKYQDYLASHGSEISNSCPLCDREPMRDFDYWKVIENNFPYDKIAQTHHMLVPKRHVAEKELTAKESEELASIKEAFVNVEYDWVIEATPKNKSLPSHFHLHLIVGKNSI